MAEHRELERTAPGLKPPVGADSGLPSKVRWWLPLLILILAVGLRAWKLTEWSLWKDEETTNEPASRAGSGLAPQ